MIYIETGSTSVAYNLALEYYFSAEKKVTDEPIFLFWHTEPTLVIGKYQNALEEINLPYAKEHGIKVVRRLSGGGTIYTDEGNWMFTFLTRGGVQEIQFVKYLTPIIDALKEMGVEATFSGRNDLMIGSRKFSGNAQYKVGDCTIHHGTLMYDVDVERMVACTTVDPQKILSKSIKSVRERVTNVAEHLPRPMAPEEFKQRVIRSVVGEEVRQYRPTEEDLARIREIVAQKFDGWEALYGAAPKFSIERTARLPGGRMTFSLDVRRGRIQHCGVSGDFFGNVTAAEFDAALKDCPYRREDVALALNNAGLEGRVYRISVDEMANLIAEI